MADIEVHIPQELGLTKKQTADLQKSFQKQLVETLKDTPTSKKSQSQVDGY